MIFTIQSTEPPACLLPFVLCVNIIKQQSWAALPLTKGVVFSNSSRWLRDCALPTPQSCTDILWFICSINSPAELLEQGSQPMLHQHPFAALGCWRCLEEFRGSGDPMIIFLFHLLFLGHIWFSVQLVYKDKLLQKIFSHLFNETAQVYPMCISKLLRKTFDYFACLMDNDTLYTCTLDGCDHQLQQTSRNTMQLLPVDITCSLVHSCFNEGEQASFRILYFPPAIQHSRLQPTRLKTVFMLTSVLI